MLKRLTEDDLIAEMYGGEPHCYYPLGKHIVRAPGVCGGRPTVKYTRINATALLAQFLHGYTAEQIVENYNHRRDVLTVEAVNEIVTLALRAFETVWETDLPYSLEEHAERKELNFKRET